MIYLKKQPLLEESYKAFVRSIDIAWALTEGFQDTVLNEDVGDKGASDRNRNRNNNDDATNTLLQITKKYERDIADLRQSTQNLKDSIAANKYKQELDRQQDMHKFENLELKQRGNNITYEPTRITKQTRPFASYPFPMNILYLAKQVFVWVGNFLTKAFAKIAELVASLTGNKMQATVQLAKDAFVKEEEFMKGVYLPVVFNNERESIQKIGSSELITYGQRINSQDKYTIREEDLSMLEEGYNVRNQDTQKFMVYDMGSTLAELKGYMATFLSMYDSQQGGVGEDLLGSNDIEQLYLLFHDQLEAIKTIKSGGRNAVISNGRKIDDFIDDAIEEKNLKARNKREWKEQKRNNQLTPNPGFTYGDDLVDAINSSYQKLEFRVDPQKIKPILDTTLINTEKLKGTYAMVERKIKSILDELLEYQSMLFKQTGTIYSAFSGETMSEMILLTNMYEKRIHDLNGQIRQINQTKDKMNNLLKGFSNIAGIFNGYNIAKVGNYQQEPTTDLVKISNEIRQTVVMLIQTIQLRYDNAYRYLDVLTSVRDLIVSVSAINNSRNNYRN